MRLAAGLVLILGLLWVSLTLGVGNAADWAVVPSVTARTEFNSNLNYDFTAPKADYIFTLAPTANFNYTTDIGQLQGSLGLTGRHYLSNGQIDHIDQNFQINGRYQAAPRLNLNLNAAYISDSSLQEEFATSGLIMTRTPRQSIQAGPGVTYALTERLSATVNYIFNKVNYQSPQFQNYTTQQAGLTLQQQLKNERTVLIGNFLAQETHYPAGDNDARSLGFQLGGTHKFSPDWEVNFLGGINISFLDFHTQVLDFSQFPFFTTNQAKVQQTTTSPFINLSFTHRWTDKFVISGAYTRNQAASAVGSMSDTNQLNLSLSYTFSDRLSGNLSGSYVLNNQISDQNGFKSDFIGVTPQLTYRLTEEINLSPGYQFGLREDTSLGKSANAQTVFLMMTYTKLAVASEKKPTAPVGTPPATAAGTGRPPFFGRIPFQLY
ncbi:MAG: hypothetical protein ACHQ2F_04935 [Desulfobaccales bacterium]